MAYYGSNWYPALGWLIFWVSLIASIVIFSKKKKWYPIIYLISVSLYVFTAGFAIDVFDLTKNGVMLVLCISAFLMILVGWYISATNKSVVEE